MSGRPPNRSRERSPHRRGNSPSRSPPRRRDDRGTGDRGYDDRGIPPQGSGEHGGYRSGSGRDERDFDRGAYGRDGRSDPGYGGFGDDRGRERDTHGGRDTSRRNDRGNGGRGGQGDVRGSSRDERGYGGGRDDRGYGGGGSGRDESRHGSGGTGRGGRSYGSNGPDRDDRGRGYGRGGRGDGGGRFGGGRGRGGSIKLPSGPPPIPVRSQIVVRNVDSIFPARTSFGTFGRPIVVYANHFQVDLKPGQGDIYHYDVVFCFHDETPTQDVRPKEVSLRVLNLLVSELKVEFPHIAVVSDGRRNLYSPIQLPFENRKIVITENFEKGKSKQWDVYIKAADPVAIRMDQVKEFFNGNLNFTPYEAIMALDIALRAYAKDKFVNVGRNFFSASNSQSVGEGSELWFGYHQSLRPTQTRFTLNIDMAATTFIQKASLPNYLIQVLNVRSGQLSFNDSTLRQAARALKGLRINVTHRDTKRVFKVTGLSIKSAGDTYFLGPDGKEKSIAEYFAEKHKPLEHPNWPCVQIGSKLKPQYLPLEVCATAGGQKAIRKETPNQVATIIKHTCTPPEERRQKIEALVEGAHFEEDNCLAAYGMTVNQKMLAVEARQLPDPEILYSNGVVEQPRDGAWNMRNKGFFEGKSLDSFAIISLCEQRAERDIQNFYHALVEQLKNVNMKGPRNAPKVLTRANRETIDSLYGRAITEAEREFGKPPVVIFCVNPTGDTANYMDLKRASDITFGIPSQCMLLKHIGKKSPQYIANLLLKVNMKLGGRNSICRNDLPKVSDVPTIIIGLDVTHPGPMDKSKPSLASAVATMDKFAARHVACVRRQSHRVEFIEELESMINELLRRFYHETYMKPERILIYRGGTSEGQFQNVLQNEVESIRRACETLDPSYKPPITYVVVQRRHHTRIFPTAAQDADRSGNCKAGTVVDSGICHPTEYDFYLMSHSGLQGCSRPAHYHVLLDDIGFSPDELQLLTYHLCYTFARCTRSVSVVPSCYYSELVAERARLFVVESSDGGSTIDGNFVESIGRMLDVHRNLSNVMYYI